MSIKTTAIFIGASAGGITALQKLFLGLPRSIQTPIIIVQHLPQNAQLKPELVFGSTTGAKLEEITDKMPIEMGHIYFGPPGYHLLIEKQRYFSLSQDEPVNYARPSIDVFFDSAARVFGTEACGVLLTGANSDGALGLRSLQKCGGIAIVQDPAEAEFPTMPQAALDLFKPNHIGSISMISKILSTIVKGDTL